MQAKDVALPQLPHDIIFFILFILGNPVYVGRLSQVSKYWKNEIKRDL